MKKPVIVLVVEDNEYYNDLLSKTLMKTCLTMQKKHDVKMLLHSFFDSNECISKIRSGELEDYDIIAFIDYYMGHGINGTHIVRLLKKHNTNSQVILLSQSKSVGEKENQNVYDFFLIKDDFAPAICSLYLEQFIDNKFS